MPDRINKTHIQFDRGHGAAIRREIGERLKTHLQREQPAMPPRLRQLLHRLSQQDDESAPPRQASRH